MMPTSSTFCSIGHPTTPRARRSSSTILPGSTVSHDQDRAQRSRDARMTRHRVAIIGLGMAVTPHARSLLDLCDRVEVAHAFSPSEARRRDFKTRFDFPLAGDLDAVLADRSVGSVLILTPPNTHLDLVRRCAAAGKHILLEKPLEISTERALELIEAARGARVTL